jgi:hypothetical protein
MPDLATQNYPEAPISAGAMSTAAVGPAVQQAALQSRQKSILEAA